MEQAQQELEQAKREQAGEKQEQALRQLESAKAELEKILRQLREEERGRFLAMLETRWWGGQPASHGCHVTPPSMLRAMPLAMPAYRTPWSAGLETRVSTPSFFNPAFCSRQVVPPSIVLKTPAG